jgi:hypothetical protein
MNFCVWRHYAHQNTHDQTMKKLVITIALLTAYAAFGNSQIITYALLPGSTITPTVGATPTGPAEALTGTFQLVAVAQGELDDVSLDFSSTSFHLTLHQPNEYAAGIGPYWVSFGADVEITGLSITAGQMDDPFVSGTYTGPMTAPSFLTFPDIRISPLNGGEFAAQLTLSAQQVPEPSSALLLLSGAVFSLGRLQLHRHGRRV